MSSFAFNALILLRLVFPVHMTSFSILCALPMEPWVSTCVSKGVSSRLKVDTCEDLEGVERWISKKQAGLIAFDFDRSGDQLNELMALIPKNNEDEPHYILLIFSKKMDALPKSLLKNKYLSWISSQEDEESLLFRIRQAQHFAQLHAACLSLREDYEEMQLRASLGAVTQGITHNMNNLLGVVIGYLDLTKLSAGKPEKQLKNLGQIEESVKRMAQIMRQLSRLSQSTPPKFSKFSVKKITEACVGSFKQRIPEAQVEVHYGSTGGQNAYTNLALMREAVAALLMNAWESYAEDTPPHNRSLSLSIEVHATEPIGKELVIRVEDQGRGLPEALSRSIFEPFVSSKQGDEFGMGLPIARHNVKSLGGTLSVSPRASGAGTQAQIIHPFMDANGASSSSGMFIG